MFEPFKLTNWVTVRETCDIGYRINSSEEVDFILGGQGSAASFELCMDRGALRKMVDQGIQAILAMNATEDDDETAEKAAKEAAEKAADEETATPPVDESA